MSKTPFVDALVQESLPIWQQCLDSDFLRGLEAGTLDEDCFKGYIVDDSLYLREYARVFAWGMTKAQTMAAMRNYYSLLSFVNENEDVARLQYLPTMVCATTTSSTPRPRSTAVPATSSTGTSCTATTVPPP